MSEDTRLSKDKIFKQTGKGHVVRWRDEDEIRSVESFPGEDEVILRYRRDDTNTETAITLFDIRLSDEACFNTIKILLSHVNRNHEKG